MITLIRVLLLRNFYGVIELFCCGGSFYGVIIKTLSNKHESPDAPFGIA